MFAKRLAQAGNDATAEGRYEMTDAPAETLAARIGTVRSDWTPEQVEALFALPFNDLLYHAHGVHRAHFEPNAVQMSTLLSIKTGGCPEDCAYCPQSVRFRTGVEAEPLMALDDVLAKARLAKSHGATRFCMGAAYRGPKPSQLASIAEMIRPRLLQPQPRHLARALRAHHPHPRLRRPPRDPPPRARRRHEGVLRRHRRHGRDAA
jgi:hypothetical protein